MPALASPHDARNPFAPHDCLGAPEALVIDGANRVCRLEAEGAPANVGARALGLGVAFVVLAALVIGRRRQARALMWALALACFALVPGLVALGVLRGDAPARVGDTAAVVRAQLEEYERFAAAWPCVELEDASCVPCQPLAAFAFPVCSPGVSGGRARLGGAGFSRPCIVRGNRLECGP